MLAGLVPILWLRQGRIIARGDDFPLWFVPNRTLGPDTQLWAVDNMGHASLFGTSIIYEMFWMGLQYLGLSTSLIQIVIQVFFFLIAGFSVRFLVGLIYPRARVARIVASFFYMFNFFVAPSRANIGFEWTYAFLPLLAALLIKTLALSRQFGPAKNKPIIYFAIVSSLALSVASVNPTNVVLVGLTLAIILIFYLATERRDLKPVLTSIGKLAALSVGTNLWWTIPILNYFVLSPTPFQNQVNVAGWSWTQARASFLNLFWLNGTWDWRPEYFPYIDIYSLPILIVLVFVPFLLAAAAALFRSRKSLFNAYIMLSVLGIMFLAKGLHDPLPQINLFLYDSIPGMVAFREPTSKFTLIMIPFLALLIGYSGYHIANMKTRWFQPTKLKKIIIVAALISIFIATSFPLVTNPIETQTHQLPFSSYISLPDYWNQATAWLNSQPGSYRVLITPGDDFYAMPYTWGYYGTDSFIDRLIQKPTLSTYYLNTYKENPQTTLTVQELYKSIQYNQTTDFKGYLDLLGVKYILQRNDIYYNFAGRQIVSPSQVRAFLTQQPYIYLANQFGQLDIYVYALAKPSVYILDPTLYQTSNIRIQNQTLTRVGWTFDSSQDLSAWHTTTSPVQFGAKVVLSLNNGALQVDLWNSTWGWKTVNSPFIPVQYGRSYELQSDLKAQDAKDVHIYVAELDANQTLITSTYLQYVGDGSFDWTHIDLPYEPIYNSTRYLQLQIWNGLSTDKPLPNTIWIKNVSVDGYVTRLNTTGLETIFGNATSRARATMRNLEQNPTKIVASIDSAAPFILALSQTLDTTWSIYANGKQLQPLTLYLGFTGFYIDQIGRIDITIAYTPQALFYYGAIVSFSAVIASIAYLAIRNPGSAIVIVRKFSALLRLGPLKSTVARFK